MDGRFPNRLKEYRRLAGLSQKKVARMLGYCDTSILSRWEHGIAIPGIVQAFRLSRIYNILPHELYGEVWKRIHSDPNPVIKSQ
jgi:transcriptional regulator with XRE-family HTH domain